MKGNYQWVKDHPDFFQDPYFSIGFLNDSTIYTCGRPFIFLSAFVTDSTVIFGYGPTIFIDGSTYVEYYFYKNLIIFHTMTYWYYSSHSGWADIRYSIQNK